VKRWLEKDYPAIRRRAKREGAQIFFADSLFICWRRERICARFNFCSDIATSAPQHDIC